MDILFTGSIVAESPITVSKPDVDKKEQGLVLRYIVTDNGAERLPVIAGETLRGKLRRISASLVRDALVKKNVDGFNLTEHYLYTVGGVKGSDRQKADDILKIARIRETNPFFALWGAGEIWIRGRLQVHAAVPECKEKFKCDTWGAMRIDDFARDPALLATLDPASQQAYVNYSDGRKEISPLKDEKKTLERELKKIWAEKKAGKPVSGDEESLKERIASLEKEIDEREQKAKNEGASEKSVNMPLSISALAAGSRLTHKMRLINVNEVEAGLFLRTLQALADDCRIGGKASLGFGDFSADWNVTLRDAPYETFGDAGRIRVAPYDPPEITDARLTRALDAWNAFEASIDDAALFARDPRGKAA